MIPGYNNFLWFIPTVKDTFQIFCAEYCGILHSQMLGKVVVVEEEEFNNWLANLVVTDRAAEPLGLQVLRRNACIGCHSLDGSQVLGPSFKGYWGKERTVITSQGEMKVVADEEYTRTQIYEPTRMVLKGFTAGLMQSYVGVVSEEELQQIIEFLKTTAE
jgi:cytochrome c oxidase subunit 2